MPTSVKGNFSFVSASDLEPHLGEGLQPYAQDFVDAGRDYGLDPRFLASVSKLETANGTSRAFVKGNNAMGISNSRGPLYGFTNPRESIYRQARSLARSDGYYAGASTIEDIGAIYAPPGAGNDPKGTNGGWPQYVGRFYREMTGGVRSEERGERREEPAGQLRARRADVGDTLEAQGAPHAEADTLVRYRAPGNEPGTVMEDAPGVPMNDALTTGHLSDPEWWKGRSKEQGARNEETAAAGAFAPTAPPWTAIRTDGRYRNLSQKERHATFDEWLTQASKALTGQPQAAQDRFRRKAEVERLRIDVEDPEATIADAYRRGKLTSDASKAVVAARDAYRQMEDLTGSLVRARLKLRPGEAVYYGPAKGLDLPDGQKARILEGTTVQGLYAVPPETPKSMSLEEFTVQSREQLHALNEGRQQAVRTAIESGELAKALPQSREVREFMEAEGGKASAKVLFENFGAIAAHTLAESAPSMVEPIAGGVVMGGPGAFLGGFEVEYANSFRDFLEEEAAKEGIDTNTEAGLMRALADEKLTAIAGDRAAKRAGPIAGVDAASAGLAGLLTKKIVGGTLGKVVTRGVVQGAIDTPAGAAGELAAQAMSGQEPDYKAATLEAVGQAATGAAINVGEAVKAGAVGAVKGEGAPSGGQAAVSPETGPVEANPQQPQPLQPQPRPQPIPDTAQGAPGLGETMAADNQADSVTAEAETEAEAPAPDQAAPYHPEDEVSLEQPAPPPDQATAPRQETVAIPAATEPDVAPPKSRLEWINPLAKRLMEEHPKAFQSLGEARKQAQSFLSAQDRADLGDGEALYQKFRGEVLGEDAGPSFEVTDGEDNIAFTGIPILTPTARNMMRATNADRSAQVKMRGKLPEAAHAAKVRAEGRRSGIMRQVAFLDRQLRAALKQVTGRSDMTVPGARAHDAQLRQMNRALKGEIPMDRLPAALRPIAMEMRAQQDALSQALIDEGVVEGDLALAVAAQKGTYLNRSYRVYDDPKWATKVPVEVRNRAKGLLRRQVKQRQGETRAQYENRIEGLIDAQLMNRGPNHAGPIAALAENSEVGKMVRKSLKQRKDIPIELRQLWGEYETADVNYARSMAKVAQLLASHQFLTEVRETGLNRYLFVEPQPGFGRQIVAPQGPRAQAMEPIAGLWTTPEVAAAFEAAFSKSGEVGWWLKWYQRLNSIGKIGKTVGNPITHVRNFTANILYSVALGNIPFRHGGKAMHTYLAELLPQSVVNGLEKGGYDAKAARDYLAEMTALGVIDENVVTGDLNAALKDALGGNITFDEFTQNRLKRAAKKPVDVAMKLYAAEDGFWKIVNFEAEKGKLRRAFPERTEVELDTEAATLVREMTPTYSLVYEWAKSIRRFPLSGPFIAFFAEVVRNNINIFNRARWEMGTDGYRAIGARRMAGLMVAHAIPIGAAAFGRMMNGLGDDEERALRRLLAPWDQNALLVPLGRNEAGDYRVINLSYADPFATFKKTFIAALRGDYAGSDEMAVAMINEALGAIFQEELLASALLDILRNKRGADGGPLFPEKGSIPMKVKASGKRLVEALEPGAAAQSRRIYNAATGRKSGSGRAYDMSDELTALLTGQRIVSLDPLNSLGYRASDFSRGWRDASSIFSRVAANRGTVTVDDLATAHREMMGAKGALMIDLGNDMRAAIRLHEPVDAVVQTVRNAKVSEENAVMAMQGGQMRGYQMSDDLFKRAAAIPGRISMIRQAVGDSIFTDKQLEKITTEQTAQKILAVPVPVPSGR